MRKFIFTCVLLVSFFTFSYAQMTVSIPNVTAPDVGQQFTVPINVTNFNNVGVVSFKIEFNPAAIRFESTTRSPQFLSSANGNLITIVRADIAPVTPTNGTLIEMTFTYLGGSSDFTFRSDTKITTPEGDEVSGINYTAGVISGPCNTRMKIGDVDGSPGSQVTVPITVTGFVDIGAVTLRIQYDQSALEYVSTTRFPEFLANANNGVITIVRADFNPVTPTTGKLLDINFNYIGGDANITFGSESSLSDTAGTAITCVNFEDGSIAELTNIPPVFTAAMPNSTVAEGSTLTFNYNVADPDTADTLTFSGDLPDGATIDAASGLFTWTPGFEAAGTHNIIVTISDGIVSVSDTAVVTVTNTNRAPVFTDSLENITNGETGQVVTFDYNAEDPDDGETLTFTLVSGPAGATINAQTGILTYTLGSIDTVTITVSVSDGETTVTTTATIAIVTSITNTGGLPTEYALAQNYPNPFNPTTTIKFSLPAESFVTLKVYNLLGEQVASLVNDFLQASHYEFSFDASTLTSGIYVYKLQAGEFISSKKMTLVK